MALMGTPVIKLEANGPHEYLKDKTQKYSVVLNTQGLVLIKRLGYKEPFRTAKRLNAEQFKEIGTDKDKALEFLKELFAGSKYELIIPEPKPEHEFSSLREEIAFKKAERLARYAHFGELIRKAEEAGHDAAVMEVPVPMVVQEHANPLDDNSPVVKQYAPVYDGVCGFAWVEVRPANSSFAKYLLKHHADKWNTSSYYGCYLWIHDYGQSMERKLAFAQAYAEVLRSDTMLQEAKVRIWAGSRMD